MITIRTERLTIIPMTENEMTDLINRYKECVPALSVAYQEMLDSCVAYPEQYAWYCTWKILLTDNQEQVGNACFKGFNNGSPEIGYGINDEYCGMGYATEAVTALCEWALSMPKVVSVEAETESNNESSKRVLLKTGFVPTGETGDEGPRYIIKLPLSRQ